MSGFGAVSAITYTETALHTILTNLRSTNYDVTRLLVVGSLYTRGSRGVLPCYPRQSFIVLSLDRECIGFQTLIDHLTVRGTFYRLILLSGVMLGYSLLLGIPPEFPQNRMLVGYSPKKHLADGYCFSTFYRIYESSWGRYHLPWLKVYVFLPHIPSSDSPTFCGSHEDQRMKDLDTLAASLCIRVSNISKAFVLVASRSKGSNSILHFSC